jgi:hypothetical protein
MTAKRILSSNSLVLQLLIEHGYHRQANSWLLLRCQPHCLSRDLSSIKEQRDSR